MSIKQSYSLPKELDSSRIDMEIYIMGDTKLDFITFLSDCFKDNFNETLSWSTFRRFHLIIPNKNSWFNIYFIILENEENIDILISSFKLYEKRNFVLMIYNINDQKSEKHIDNLIENFIQQRNKIYEGILSPETISKNLKKISSEKIDTDDLKKQLSFLTENNNNLIYKIGFEPNSVNKRTKNYKKNDNSNNNILYEISQDIFFLSIKGEIVNTNFQGIMNFLVKEFFTIMKINANKEDKELGDNSNGDIFTNNFDIGNWNKKNKEDRNIINYLVKGIDCIVILYISIAIYKFISS